MKHRETGRVFDELLVIQSQSGDEKAMSLLVKRWNTKMLRQAYILTDNRDAIKDIVQESWHTIVKNLTNLRDPSRFGVWVYRIVRGKSVDWIRRNQKCRKYQKQQIVNEVEKAHQGLRESVDSIDSVESLREAMKKLPGSERFILSLHYLDGYSVREISDAVNIPPGTVKSRLFHARKHLGKFFDELNK